MCSTLNEDVPKYKRRCQISSEIFSAVLEDFGQLSIAADETYLWVAMGHVEPRDGHAGVDEANHGRHFIRCWSMII